MIHSSKTCKSLVRVEVQSPYVIVRCSNPHTMYVCNCKVSVNYNKLSIFDKKNSMAFWKLFVKL